MAIKSPTVNVTPKPIVGKVFAFSFTLLGAVGIVEGSAKGATDEVPLDFGDEQTCLCPCALDLRVDCIGEESSATSAKD